MGGVGTGRDNDETNGADERGVHVHAHAPTIPALGDAATLLHTPALFEDNAGSTRHLRNSVVNSCEETNDHERLGRGVDGMIEVLELRMR